MIWWTTDYFAEKRLENRIMNETNKSLKELLADKLGISLEKLYIAPEVKQEPFGYVREIRPMEWKFSKTTSWGPEVWKPVFTFPIDAQAEIRERDARIAELETNINALAREQAQKMLDNGTYSDKINQQAAEISRLKALVGTKNERKVMNDVTLLPDGSAFCVLSFPLPKDHWLYAPREYASDESVDPIDLPAPILTHEQRDSVIAAIRYAVRASTNCGKEDDFDPDAMVQNAVYALCGPIRPR